jgi:hypothetical protein
MDKLKPCPFCGGEMNMTYSTPDQEFHLWHKMPDPVCSLGEPFIIPTNRIVSKREDAVKAWNRRVNNGN